ncbi:unnamed protein product [Lathyrus sativus]|nr:unnamed protein product [Lathyrus sativus]
MPEQTTPPHQSSSSVAAEHAIPQIHHQSNHHDLLYPNLSIYFPNSHSLMINADEKKVQRSSSSSGYW